MINYIALGLMQVCLIAAGAHFIGRTAARQLLAFRHPSLKFSFHTAFGLLLISCVTSALVYLHVSSRTVLRAFIFIICIPGLYEWGRTVRKGVRGYIRISQPETNGRGGRTSFLAVVLSRAQNVEWLLYLGLAVYLLWAILCAALPASARDELIYHLDIPLCWLESAGAVSFPDNIFAYYPHFGESLFLLGLAGSGECAAKLFHVLFGLLLAVSTYGFARACLSRVQSLFAVAILLSLPSIMVTLSWAYVDLMYAEFALLALLATAELHTASDIKWSVTAGISAGGALLTKYSGFFLLPMLACLSLICFYGCRAPRDGLGYLKRLAILVLFPLFMIAFHLLGNWQETGWPLFPFYFYPAPLEPYMNWDVERARLCLHFLGLFGSALDNRSVLDGVLAPIYVFLKGRFNDPALYEGVLSPVFLIIPFLVVRRKRPAAVTFHGLFVLLYLYYWTITTRQVRFLFPVLPSLCFLLLYGISKMRCERAMLGILVVSLGINMTVGVRQVLARNPVRFWTGEEPRTHYLSRQWDGYPIARKLDEMLSPQDCAYLIDMKNYGYHFTKRRRSDFVFERYNTEKFLRQGITPFFTWLRNQGITHIVLNDEFIRTHSWGLENELIDRFDRFIDRYATLLYSADKYHIYKLIG